MLTEYKNKDLLSHLICSSEIEMKYFHYYFCDRRIVENTLFFHATKISRSTYHENQAFDLEIAYCPDLTKLS